MWSALSKATYVCVYTRKTEVRWSKKAKCSQLYGSLRVLVGLLFVVHHVVVMDVHEDGEWLTNDDGHPHCSVAVVTPQAAANKPG